MRLRNQFPGRAESQGKDAKVCPTTLLKNKCRGKGMGPGRKRGRGKAQVTSTSQEDKLSGEEGEDPNNYQFIL